MPMLNYDGKTFYSDGELSNYIATKKRMASSSTGASSLYQTQLDNYNRQLAQYSQRVAGQATDVLNSAKVPDASAATSAGVSAANSAAQGNVSRLLGSMPKIIDTVKATGKELDAYIQQAMFSMYDNIAPGWREMVQSAAGAAGNVSAFAKDFAERLFPEISKNLMSMGGTATQQAQKMMRGEIPGDVMSQIRSASAERSVAGLGMTGGASGSASRNLTARDLGTTSLAVMQQGQGMAQTAAGLYAQLTGTGTATGALLGAPASVGATGAQAINAMTPDLTGKDWLNTINGLLGTLGRAGTVDPTSVMSNYQNATQIQSNLDWIKKQSAANLMLGSAGLMSGMGAGAAAYGGIK